ncbi:hypothetical protein ONA91_27320 [Micromonospora sp. DR5-3]|uniref:hypothetical protein n=1 Tax=unclassified Micromonospora TaxID=2617518 RepID=UPI0011D7A40F|nr:MULTISPECIES: hypothetical protein [unclassified Micromonospora]MCW3818166.1 hypothetical protein [Micromonospora sp. DR5-3]TYC21357.1 hypothetical protein FXF52_26345 [Micromonospora sp. MP36]
MQGTTLAPGTSGTVTVRFPRDLPNGPWQAEVRLQSGLVKKTATSRVTFPEPGQVGTARPTDTGPDSPWLLGGMSLAAGLVILVGLAIVARPDRRRALGRALTALRPAASSRRTGSPTS